MVATQTTQSNLAEFSRCDDRSWFWLSEEEQVVKHLANKADASIAEKVDRAFLGFLISIALRQPCTVILIFLVSLLQTKPGRRPTPIVRMTYCSRLNPLKPSTV